jgi:hypothetical protein
MSCKFSIAATCLVFAACASPALHYSGLVTAEPDEPHQRDTATQRIPLKDRVTVVTNVVSTAGGHESLQHAVHWNWYEGQTLIAEQSKTLAFTKTPYRFSRSLAASDLGLGHYRVEVLVDGVRVDEQTFDVVPY